MNNDPKTVEEAFDNISELLGRNDASSNELLHTLAFAYFFDKTHEQKQKQFGLQVQYFFWDSPSKRREQLEKTAVLALSDLIKMIPAGVLSRGWADYRALTPSADQVAMAENLRSLAKASKEFADQRYADGHDCGMVSAAMK